MNNEQGILYILKDKLGYVKVGITTDIENRFRGYITHNPHIIEWSFWACDSYKEYEKDFHNENRDKLVQGEWYLLDDVSDDIHLLIQKINVDSKNIETEEYNNGYLGHYNYQYETCRYMIDDDVETTTLSRLWSKYNMKWFDELPLTTKYYDPNREGYESRITAIRDVLSETKRRHIDF